MKYDKQQAVQWLNEVTNVYPSLLEKLTDISTTRVLLLGASLVSLYHRLGWSPPLKRISTDIDLSIGVATGSKAYKKLKQALVDLGYRQDAHLPYRLYSPQHPGRTLHYLDLLAHPSGQQVQESYVRHLMGAGPGFSFGPIHFALQFSRSILKNIYFPDPIAFFALKRQSYLDEPIRRVRDLADIVEVAAGMVSRGTHFELKKEWQKARSDPCAKNVKNMFRNLLDEKNVQWDLDNIRQELLGRGLTGQEVEEHLPRQLEELLGALEG